MQDILESKQRDELQIVARKLGLRGYRRLTKPELIAALLQCDEAKLRRALNISWWDRHHNHVYGLVGIFIGLVALAFTIRPHLAPQEPAPPTSNSDDPVTMLPLAQDYDVSPPTLTYGFIGNLASYATGLRIYDLAWKESFREYLFRVRNESEHHTIVDFRLYAQLPGGVVKTELISQEGCEEVFIPSEAFPSTINQDGKAIRVFQMFTNELRCSIARMHPRATAEIRLIMTTADDAHRGVLRADFRYGHPTPDKKGKHRYWINLEDQAMKIDYENPIEDEYEAQIRFVPEEVIVFHPDGTVSLEGDAK